MSRRPLLRGIAALVLAAALVALVGALQWRPILRLLAEQRLAAATGCAVRVTGPVDASLGLAPALRLAEIAFTAREGSAAACRGQLAELELAFRLWGLRIERLDAREGEVQLEMGAEVARLRVESLAITPGAQPETLAAQLSGQLTYADATLPVALSASITSQGRRFSADDLTLDVGESHVTGSFSADLPAVGRPRIEARLDAKPLQLLTLPIGPRASDAGDVPKAPGVWSDEPFDLERLRSFDGKLVARAEDVRGVDGALLESASLEGELERGKLSLRHLGLAIDGGRLTGELRSDTSVDPPTFALEAEARGIQLSQLLEQIERSSAYSGVLHGHLKLEGQGATPRALAASLAGEVTFASPGGTIATQHASVLTKDFFSVLRPSQRRESEPLNCLVVDLGVAAGVASVRTWVLDTRDLVVLGAGTIDLGARQFDMRFVPKPRDASPLSTAATIRLTGPLTAPTVTTEKASLLTSSGRALLGTVTWVSRSRAVLHRLIGAEGDQGRCAALLKTER